MSVKKYTDNLNLITYIVSTHIPTFLDEMSHNMEIIDSVINTANISIADIQTRLAEAEQTLSDISVESIEDYKIRLTALEAKVNVNVNAIKDINNQLTIVNNDIRLINTELGEHGVAIDSLNATTSSQGLLISTLTSDLTALTNRVTVLESCCDTVEREIVDLQRDVNGFNDDITILAGQVENISLVVNNLSNTLSSYDIDGLIAMVTAIEGEIGNADISATGASITDAIVELQRQINLLNPQGIDSLTARVTALETEMTSKVEQSDIDNSINTAFSNSELGRYTYIKSDL